MEVRLTIYYLDNTGGNDANDGLSTATAWKTITKVNGITFNAGDTLLLKRGESWTGRFVLLGSGTSGNSIRIGAYGLGNKPHISGTVEEALKIISVQYIIVEDLSLSGVGVDASMVVQAKHIIINRCDFNDGIYGGLYINGTAAQVDDIIINDCTCINSQASGFYAESAGGIGSPFTNITFNRCVAHNNGTHTDLDHGFYVKYIDGITISHCESYDNYSHGIQSTGCTNVLIDSNNLHENRYFGLIIISAQTNSNTVIKNNLIWGHVWDEIILDDGGDDVQFLNNTIVHNDLAGGGAGVNFQSTAHQTNIVFKNNIVYMAQGLKAIYVASSAIPSIDFNNNCYYVVSATNDHDPFWATSNYNLTEWRALSGSPDANSIQADPFFVTPITDLRLAVGSPCIDIGAIGLGVTLDYAGTSRGSTVDIGAYEATGSPSTPPGEVPPEVPIIPPSAPPPETPPNPAHPPATISPTDNLHAYPAILGIDIDYDNPEDFKLILSNRLRLDDSAFQFSDLFQQSISSGITTEFNSEIWKNFQDNYRDSVSDFIKNALDASAKSIVDAKNQSFVIDGNGIRGRYLNPDPVTNPSKLFDKEQIGIINNMIVFTDDNWDTARTALGKVYTTSGSVATWGLVAESIFGNLIVGNKLYIENGNKTFKLDGNGATLVNANFTLFGNSNKNKILLDPITGISISKKNSSGTFTDDDRVFYVDTDGNLVIKGNLQAVSGTFTGTIIVNRGKIGMWNIDDFGLYDDSKSNYIYGNGSIKLGKLRIDGSEAWFDGNIYAKNLDDQINGEGTSKNQIRFLNADVITAGTLRAIDIYGCRIYWPGASLESGGYGIAAINGLNNLVMYSGARDSILNLTPSRAQLYSYGTTEIGDVFNGKTVVKGSLETIDPNGTMGWGMTANVLVGGQMLNFVNGLLVDPNHYTSSGSYTSGSVTPPVVSSGSVTFTQLRSWNVSDGWSVSPAFATYEGNGIIQATPYVNTFTTFVYWIFRITWDGISSQVGEVRMDWEHLSGNCQFTSYPAGSGFEIRAGGWGFDVDSWEMLDESTVIYMTPALRSWMASYNAERNNLLSSGTLYDVYNQTDGRLIPDLSPNEDRWFIAIVEFDEIITTCQWKIKRLYVRPPGTTGESDITIWQNA